METCDTYCSHMNFHLNVIVPVYLSSTIWDGLCNSMNLTLLVACGAVAEASRD